MAKAISIVVLHTEGCTSTLKTVERIRDCISDIGIPTDLRNVLVKNAGGGKHLEVPWKSDGPGQRA